MYDFVTKFEMVCLGLIAPNLRYLKAGLQPVHVSFTLSNVWCRQISKISFLRKVICPFRKISKCETGSLHEKRKYPLNQGAETLYLWCTHTSISPY